MAFLSRLRPSNLVILAALPFIVWLFATEPDYSRSLKAILGIESGAQRYVPGFLLMTLTSGAGLLAVAYRERRTQALALVGLCLISALAIAFGPWALAFAASAVANAVDPFTSPLVVAGETPRRLTDAALHMVAMGLHRGALAVALASAAGFLMVFQSRWPRLAIWARQVIWLLHGAIAAYLLLFAYIGFAAGVAISIRAAILAYMLAIFLGLSWVGLMQMRSRRWTFPLYALFIAATLALALWQFSQPHVGYVLVGTPEGRVGVVKDTPAQLIGAVQTGQFPGAPGTQVETQSFATPDAALAALAASDGPGAVFVPATALPAGASPIWTADALPDGPRAAGIALSVLAILVGLLTFGGWLHSRHPLSVGAEFIIDTIRGIPMLVIVLYIGLPLAGAVKEASGGFIDPPNMLRGILAMALAYSAYLAEIFRAGINAVPTGQGEAARSLGLTRWQTARQVILPQAFRIIIPPLGNEFIAILKDTSLLSILSIRDITQRMREFQSASFLPFAPYNSAAIFYVLLTLVAASLVASVERRFHVARR